MTDMLSDIFNILEGKFQQDKIKFPITYYFSLGNRQDEKWTLSVSAEGCSFKQGKTDNADCVLKCSTDFFRKLVLEGYSPGITDILTGQIKTNDDALLKKLKEFFP